MEQLVINGGKPLRGTVNVNGAKNAALAILPAVILSEGISTIDNLPGIEDIKNLVQIFENLGAQCTFSDKHTLTIDASTVNSRRASYGAVKRIRASYYLLGALLGRFNEAEVAMPGGCNFGQRPIDQHIKGFMALGAKVAINHGMVRLKAEKLVGTNIYLDVVSVGATINIMIAAARAEGTTIIENAAKEPHVVDTANFLNMMGANIKGAGTDLIRISGVNKLFGGSYTIIPDQIEAGTYMIIAAATKGTVRVQNVIPKHMDSLTAKLTEMKCIIKEGEDYIEVFGPERLMPTNVKTMVYPGFPTDLQPQIIALLACAQGTGIVTENVWENRFQYVNELKRLGCNITVEGRVAVVKGPATLSGAEVHAPDLRAGAALVVAGLAAKGTTTIMNAKQINRGYEDIEGKLSGLGADIRKINA
ncbi:MAG: UDP-N-acetylglucosamine 1-carboxyvinyltransferase [Defluviitaleaceae bacterium]|nr:UDP-N-acetylglucosamine 1-carboxyvinyltransferase [Defluviitaleaceae bacterium]